jgi:hypothetical protein
MINNHRSRYSATKQPESFEARTRTVGIPKRENEVKANAGCVIAAGTRFLKI